MFRSNQAFKISVRPIQYMFTLTKPKLGIRLGQAKIQVRSKPRLSHEAVPWFQVCHSQTSFIQFNRQWLQLFYSWSLCQHTCHSNYLYSSNDITNKSVLAFHYFIYTIIVFTQNTCIQIYAFRIRECANMHHLLHALCPTHTVHLVAIMSICVSYIILVKSI